MLDGAGLASAWCARASGAGASAGLEKVIAQLEGLQKFHVGVESRVRELLQFIEREMPR